MAFRNRNQQSTVYKVKWSCWKSCGSSKKFTKENNVDFFSALFEYRNTPLAGTDLSPAELVGNSSLSYQQCKKVQIKRKLYFDRNAQNRADLIPNQKIYVLDNKTKEWQKSRIVKEAGTPRSCVVETDTGNVRRRNSSKLRERRRRKGTQYRTSKRARKRQWKASDKSRG